MGQSERTVVEKWKRVVWIVTTAMWTRMVTIMGTRMGTMMMWTRMMKTIMWTRMVPIMGTRRIMMITVVGLSSKMRRSSKK